MIKVKKQLGEVSIFIVIFFALLITVVIVSFVSIMVKTQQQANTVDLSQSAFDSAQAGVEDAKRALLRLQSICDTGSAADCALAKSQFNTSACNSEVKKLLDVAAAESNNEVKVQTQTGVGSILDQAYTCVKISLDTVDYLGTLSADESKMIPLNGTGPFNTVKIEWFNSDNLNSDDNFSVDLQPGSSSSWPLLARNSWKPSRPPILRTQLIQFGSGFKLSDLDNTINGESDANTLFLYPSASNSNDVKVVKDRDLRKTATGAPLPVSCLSDLTAGGYSCSASLQLPAPIGGGARTAFLRLGALYNKTNYRVTLQNDAQAVKFNAVQPTIDSTGRANDLFRRVQTRVELIDVNFPYPDAELDITGNLCKTFLVTDNVADYQAGSCTP